MCVLVYWTAKLNYFAWRKSQSWTTKNVATSQFPPSRPDCRSYSSVCCVHHSNLTRHGQPFVASWKFCKIMLYLSRRWFIFSAFGGNLDDEALSCSLFCLHVNWHCRHWYKFRTQASWKSDEWSKRRKGTHSCTHHVSALTHTHTHTHTYTQHSYLLSPITFIRKGEYATNKVLETDISH
jgi:hypothetical protein